MRVAVIKGRHWAALAVAVVGLVSLGACSSSSGSSGSASDGRIVALGAENEYADVISQIGGQYVNVTAIMSDPNTDPHTFEASPSISKTVAAASLVVQNGVGYDSFMGTIEKASPNSARKVIDVQHLRNLPDSTPNPHLWYDPATMPVVAKQIAADLSALQPDHASYFQQNAATFVGSLKAWTDALAAFSARYPHTPVAVTEPVADYMLKAAGTDNVTPFSLETAIMNGTDPAPQDISAQMALLSGKRVKVFLYNQQVTDDVTTKFLAAARAAHIPVVGVYETMPSDGYHYQKWMVAEVNALEKAVAQGVSTEKL